MAKKNLAEASVYYRARNNLTQEVLAKQCGLTRATIYNVERGKSVSRRTEAKIRILLGEDKGGDT